MDHLSGFQSLRANMERCSEIVTTSYSLKPEEMLQFEGELPPNHTTGHRRQRYWVTEMDGDLVVALPGTTHPLDWSSNMRVHYTPIDGTHPPANTPTEQLEKQPCAHAGFYFRAETIPTLALLEQAAAKGLRLVLTGHSLGAAVANLCTLTALSAQKKAREAAANAALAKRTASAAAAAAADASGSPTQGSSGPKQQQQQQQQQRKKRLSPWEAAAAAASVAQAEAHTNHSWCSANSDVLVSPQAALVEVLCVAFASPHWANQSLADYIEDNDWGDIFVNVVVPEDYCLKLFNNVLTSANPAERHTLSKSSSRCSMRDSSSANKLADEQEQGGAMEQDPCCPADPLAAYAAAADATGASASDKQALLYSMNSDSSTATTSSAGDSSSSGGGDSLPPRYSYQPAVAQQQRPVSALAGTRRKQKKQQLSFTLPDQRGTQASAAAPAADAAAGAAISAAAAAAAAVAEITPAAAGSGSAQLDACRPPAVSVVSRDERLGGLYTAADNNGSWNELRGVLPSSPSCASLSSLSSLNSTRSWTLMAYLPDVLIRSFSNGSNGGGSGSSGGLEDLIASAGSSRDSSDGGCPNAAADAIAAVFAGADVGTAAPPPAAAAVAAAAPVQSAGEGEASLLQDSSSSANSARPSSSGNRPGLGMRHAKSAVDLSLSSLSDTSSSSFDYTPPLAALKPPAALPAVVAAAAGAGGVGTSPVSLDLPSALQRKSGAAARAKSLRRSVTSASLSALSAPSQPLLAGGLRLSSSLAMVGALLPSLRSMVRASRLVLGKVSSIKEAAFDVPLTVFEAGLIKALKPPMYKPVGQQWILSATGLVPQAQPIHMYPKHVHDVYWHKELALVAFREHSILFYQKRLLQQASRR